MLNKKKRCYLLLIHSVICIVFVTLSFFLIRRYGVVFTLSVAASIFFICLAGGNKLYQAVSERCEYIAFNTQETVFLKHFIERLRFCYSLDDFFDAAAELLECAADCSILFIDKRLNMVIYNSPNRFTCRPETLKKLNNNFSAEWNDGVFFLDDELGLKSDYRNARGFFLVSARQHLYIFCRYTKLFDTAVYSILFEEFKRFQTRVRLLSTLTKVAELSREWELLAEAQRSFLPHNIPPIAHLRVAAYFKPLINVSGDYYMVLPLCEHKTLVMLGDVSGKGLAAALVMGIVMNTIKILANKEDLPGAVYAIDSAIKKMRLQDKYTVLFIGIIDTKDMYIRYINASMADPMILTRSPRGHNIKKLGSNCSLIGIIDLDNVQTAEQKLFHGDVLLMVSDGVTEVKNKGGEELGAAQVYLDTIEQLADKAPSELIAGIAGLIDSFSGGKKLRDDVTMLAVKLDG